jgi:hypothetical protein
MRLISGFIFSCCLLLAFGLMAQNEQPKQGPDEESKKDQKKPPKPKADYRPTGIRIGTDLISLIKSNTQKDFTGWEMNADVDFSNYFLTLDVGNWGRDYTLLNGNYKNSGNYFRIGADINFLQKDPDHNMFFLGLRYGRSSFSESLTYQETLPIFGTQTHIDANPSVTGSWVELTTGLRVKVWKGFWMGYTARMKLAANTSGATPALSPYDMPGYGLIQQSPWWGFNYQVFWRIPIRKEPAPAVKARD